MSFIDIKTTAFTIWEYPISYIELIGTIFGLISVYLAYRSNILTWPTGIINEIAFFILFYQVQLYSDMLLQVYFFVITIYGWYFWSRNNSVKSTRTLTMPGRSVYLCLLILLSLFLGWLMSDIHLTLPNYFSLPAAFPYADGFTTAASILATILLAQRKLENWILWIAVDVVSIVLYTMKGIHVVAIEYAIFLTLAIMGFLRWKKEMNA